MTCNSTHWSVYDTRVPAHIDPVVGPLPYRGLPVEYKGSKNDYFYVYRDVLLRPLCRPCKGTFHKLTSVVKRNETDGMPEKVMKG